MVFVRERGRAMAAASAATPTSMTAVVGGQPDEVLAALEAQGLTAANNNGSGQIVAAGTVEQLAALAANPPTRARLIPLSVAGAFHTVHMEPAVDRLADARRRVTHDPRTRLLSNPDGQVVHDGGDVLRRLVGQVASPVRWDLCMAAMADLGVTGLLELPPAGTLTGIAKRNLKGVELFALNTPDQLAEARDFLRRHGDRGHSVTVPDDRPGRPAVRTSTGSPYARVLGIGGYRPRRVVDNAEICTYIDSSDEWIRTRSGIGERRWASPDETVQMMSVVGGAQGDRARRHRARPDRHRDRRDGHPPAADPGDRDHDRLRARGHQRGRLRRQRRLRRLLLHGRAWPTR